MIIIEKDYHLHNVIYDLCDYGAERFDKSEENSHKILKLQIVAPNCQNYFLTHFIK